jgi:Uma2 family endonuclease
MTGVVHPPTLTLEEFLGQPETEPASEFIDGRVEQKPMPQGKQSPFQLKSCQQVNHIAVVAQIAMALQELRFSFAGRSIVPDAVVFIPFEPDGEVTNLFTTHPDRTVDILSPEQTATKVIRRILHCLHQRAELSW